MKNPKFSRAFEVVSELPEPLKPLKKLARNFLWSWNHEIRDLFRSIDKDVWDGSEHNTILFLNRVPKARWAQLTKDGLFMNRLKACEQILDNYLDQETWFQREFPDQEGKAQIAYFCFEFGITEGLPIYSGGLGVLAGDHLKTASDLGLPLVGLGLLYNRGYFRQQLTHDGWQQEIYPQYDFYQMPLQLMRDTNGDPIRVPIEFPDRVVTLQIWRADVGRIPLYLLDSNVLENAPNDQSITDSLYSGDEEMRIRQEIILGIGGMKALAALGISPTVCHMNEGHASFLAIERIRQYIERENCDFRVARAATVHGNVFTTHTPVPAGFDLFPPQLLEKYLSNMAEKVKLKFDDFIKLGRFEPENTGEAFNMAIFAMETANHVNGVAKLHGEVSRSMFARRWEEYPENEVPIDHVTNGIHTMTWVGRKMARLLDEFCGDGWRRNPSDPNNWKGVDKIPDNELWQVREDQRGALIRYVRRRLERDLARRHMRSRVDSAVINEVLDPRVLTIGFARRFASYKRGSLMISDPERIKSILYHKERPVQIVIAGKSHPRDDAGKKLIQDLFRYINDDGARTRMVFLEDYDMGVARMLVQGVDVWLNNPRRPNEASGTSGMKVVPNGGLNCSILDGWWDEGYDPSLGFVIGDRSMSPDAGHQDWLDSHSLYEVLENQVTPIFYHRVEQGVPLGWINMIRESLKHLGPFFSTDRMVQDYARKFYIPASDKYVDMSANGSARAKAGLEWRTRVQANWAQVKILDVTDNAKSSNLLGSPLTITAKVHLGVLSKDDVRVQAVTGKVGMNRELTDTQPVELEFEAYEDSIAIFKGDILCTHPGHQGYALRIVPKHEDLSIPAELNFVRWQ
ncbi:MAG: alpha-glucan family phosphorylase [Armatimonadetes bacterium]|nr:alpha-glucan family phosphorylase [Armatimonadota bacterium]MBS1702367.1 alpha-glucan family phosphorylase [Armatimonadota bacterium]MBS1725795.1 alpha-glucan family phosphorylase [Armatimonadota bacterium]